MNSYYQLDTDEYSFYLIIIKGDGIDNISIGGRKAAAACVNISVSRPDSLMVQRGFHKLDSATIPVLAWDSKCAINKDLEKGTGTITMINILLSEVCKRYPYVNTYSFYDNSLIRCDNGKQISLLHLSVIEHNKSWYERHFNAYILNKEVNENYKNGIMALNSPDVKESFDTFKKIIYPSKASGIDSLKLYYESSSTYHDFFISILEKEGKKGLCNMIVGWIDIFLLYIFRCNPLSVEWAINKESISLQEVTEIRLINKPAQSGGRRYTKKNIPKVLRVNINDSYYT